MATSGSPQSIRNDAEWIVEMEIYKQNGLQEPLLSEDEDEGDISVYVERQEESCDVENPNTPLAPSIEEKLDLLPTFSGKHCCIYKVPEQIRDIDKAAFTPKVVSIGPLHHGKENLQAMEAHKKKYLKEFLERTNVSMEEFIAIVQESEVRLRDHYAETIKMTSDEFVEMILVDATFIIELLWKHSERNKRVFINDRIFNRPWMLGDVKLDMLMLENQIPYFILEKLYNAAKVKPPSIKEGQPAFIALFYHCFEQSFPRNYDLDKLTVESVKRHFLDFFRIANQPAQKENQMTVESVKRHFLDFFRIANQPAQKEPAQKENQMTVESVKRHFLDFFRIANQPAQKEPAQKENQMTVESVKNLTITELEQAGVTFEALDLTEHDMFDIRFYNGILKIPKITFKERTNVLLRNLIAFEQRHCITNFFGDYAIFLDSLIDTEKDIDILIRNEVLEARASDSKEVADLFNSISSSCALNRNHFYYAGVWKELDKYCKVPWHRWEAILRQTYFRTPWAIISLLAAAVLLILTALQTVWSMTRP